MVDIIPFRVCYGCNAPLELSKTRVYHVQCDPQAKVDHLRGLLKELYRVHQARDSSEFTPPGYEKVIAQVGKEVGDG